MILADKIIDLRKKQGWSQEQLANELGVSRQSVSKWESAMSIPDLDKIIKLSTLFGVSTDYLLKDELETMSPSETVDTDEQSVRVVDAEEAHAYMQLVENVSNIMAAAIALFVIAPIPVILLTGFWEMQSKAGTALFSEDAAGGLGAAILMLMIVVGVVILVLNGMKLSGYEYLEKEEIALQYGVEGIVSKKMAEFEPRFRTSITLGVALCIVGVIPIILAGSLGSEDFVVICMVCVMLALIATGVYFFVRTTMIRESYQKLLQQGDYTPEEKALNQKVAFFPGVYWCLVTACYLGISFYFDSWGRSWMIWPVAGVAFVAALEMLKAILKRR